MIRITENNLVEAERELLALEIAMGEPRGTLVRLHQALHILAGRDTTRPADPNQRPKMYIPGLAAHAFWDSAEFGWASRLEDSFDVIVNELLELRSTESFGREPDVDLVDRGVWAQYHFHVGERRIDTNCQRCPRTAEILETIEDTKNSGLTLFSAHAPGTHVRPHCGPHNARLRCHFGLVIPDGCEIRVGQQIKTWEQGKCTIFDDSFEHEVWNRGHHTRIILIMDVWHPEVTRAERLAITHVLPLIKTLILKRDEQVELNRWEKLKEPDLEPLPVDWWM
jgi:hypothetical protein